MNVVFVEPFFPAAQRYFAGALAEAGATVIGVGEYPAGALDDQLRAGCTATSRCRRSATPRR
jgi:hypothetical protein